MKKRQLVTTIAKRLPFTTARQVEDVLEVATELWAEELQAGKQAHLPGIGRFWIERQTVRSAGAVQSPSGELQRVYGRFRPARELIARLEGQDE